MNEGLVADGVAGSDGLPCRHLGPLRGPPIHQPLASKKLAVSWQADWGLENACEAVAC